MLEVQVNSIIGLPLRNGWTTSIGKKDNGIYASLAVESINAVNLGKEIKNLLETDQVKDPAKLHAGILDLIKKSREEKADIQLAIASYSEDKITFLTYNGAILLKRADKIARILESDTKLRIIQGPVKENDLIILSTRQAAIYLNEIELKLYREFPQKKLLLYLSNRIRKKANSSLSSLVFVSFTEALPNKDKEKQPALELDLEINEKKVATVPEATPKAPLVTQPKINFSKNSLDILQKFVKIFKFLIKQILKLFQTLQRFISSKILKKEVYLEKKANSKIIIFVLLFFFIAIVCFSTIIFKNITEAKNLTNLEAKISPIQKLITLAKQEEERNPLEARRKVEYALEKLNTLKQEVVKSKKLTARVEEEITKSQTYYQEISGKEELQALTIYLDLSQINPGFLASIARANQEKAIFFDISKQEILILDLASAQTKFQKLNLEQIKDLYLDTNNYLTILGKGIKRVTLDNLENIETLKEEGDSNKEATLINSFNDFIYIFNKEKRNIYRYALNEGKLSEAIGWIQDKKDLDFESIISMQIDGDIYLSTNQGQIIKFSKGQKADFQIQGLKDPLNTNNKIFTKENYQNLYLLDAETGRIIIIDKQGIFQKEIKSPSLKGSTDFIVNEEKRLILILNGSLIYQSNF